MSETTQTQNQANAQTQAVDKISVAKEKFELACRSAQGLQMVNNFGAAFQAVTVVNMLREALTDEVMNRVFMPLMNTRLGFLTDRTPEAVAKGKVHSLYPIATVRDAIIEAVGIGLTPTGNQMNIIAGRMYPTKEGYTALLRRLGIKYFIEVGYDKSQTQGFAEIPCKISYEWQGEKNSFTVIATVKKDSYSSADQLRGKAERRAKKSLYEYITGCDYGDADEDSSRPVDTTYVDVTDHNLKGKSIDPNPEAQTAEPPKPTQQQANPAEFNQPRNPGF